MTDTKKFYPPSSDQKYRQNLYRKKTILCFIILFFLVFAVGYILSWHRAQERIARQVFPYFEQYGLYDDDITLRENFSVGGFPFLFTIELSNPNNYVMPVHQTPPGFHHNLAVGARELEIQISAFTIIQAIIWGRVWWPQARGEDREHWPLGFVARDFHIIDEGYGTFSGDVLKATAFGVPAYNGYPTRLAGQNLLWRPSLRNEAALGCQRVEVEVSNDAPFIDRPAELSLSCRQAKLVLRGYEETIELLDFFLFFEKNQEDITIEHGFLSWRGGEIHMEGQISGDYTNPTIHLAVEIKNYPEIIRSLQLDGVLDGQSMLELQARLQQIFPLFRTDNNVIFPVMLENNMLFISGTKPLPLDHLYQLVR